MRVLLLTIGLFALICVNLALADDTAGPTQNVKRTLKLEDWEPTHYKVYDTQGYFQPPSKTFELLKQLQKIYEPFSDKETNGRKTIINELIEKSEMDPEKCTRDYYKKFYDLIKWNSPYVRTVQSYLVNNFIDFLIMCEEKVLHTNVPLIDQVQRNELTNLVKHIAEYKIDGKAAGYQAIASIAGHIPNVIYGIYSYLESKSDIKLDESFMCKETGKAKLKELFVKEVLEMCDAWVHATDPMDALKNYPVTIELTSTEMRWLNYGRLCRFIVDKRDDILVKMSYQFEAKKRADKDKEPKVGFRKGLAKKFGFGKGKENAQ